MDGKLTEEERTRLTYGDGTSVILNRERLDTIVESIVAARVQALTSELDELRGSLPKRTNDWIAHCKRLDAERDAVSDQLVKAWKELGVVEAENATLSARLNAAAKLCEGLDDAPLDRAWAFKLYEQLGIPLPQWELDRRAAAAAAGEDE